MRTSIKLAAGVGAVVLAGAVVTDVRTPGADRTEADRTGVEVPAGDAVRDGDRARGELLLPAAGGDGDSWRDTSGREYRLGLVNAPETNECFGAQATAERMRLTAAGFTADVYETDRYGRGVAVVTTADGTNLNVHLARHGFADDRYLQRFRSENPSLAAELDEAFAAARQEEAGLWGACGGSSRTDTAPAPAPAPAPQPIAGSCHPDYVTCIAVQGDGSGNGRANDLDCGSIRQRVQVRQVGVDPYRLDADGNGWGCEAY